jgi:hypothetical protein
MACTPRDYVSGFGAPARLIGEPNRIMLPSGSIRTPSCYSPFGVFRKSDVGTGGTPRCGQLVGVLDPEICRTRTSVRSTLLADMDLNSLASDRAVAAVVVLARCEPKTPVVVQRVAHGEDRRDSLGGSHRLRACVSGPTDTSRDVGRLCRALAPPCALDQLGVELFDRLVVVDVPGVQPNPAPRCLPHDWNVFPFACFEETSKMDVDEFGQGSSDACNVG